MVQVHDPHGVKRGGPQVLGQHSGVARQRTLVAQQQQGGSGSVGSGSGRCVGTGISISSTSISLQVLCAQAVR